MSRKRLTLVVLKQINENAGLYSDYFPALGIYLKKVSFDQVNLRGGYCCEYYFS